MHEFREDIPNARFWNRSDYAKLISAQVMLAASSAEFRLCADYANSDVFLGFRASEIGRTPAVHARIPCNSLRVPVSE